MLERRILTAEVVYNGLGLPREKGAVAVQKTGDSEQVVGIDSLEQLERMFPGAPITNVGFALTPLPVNAHLELTSLDKGRAASLSLDATEVIGAVAFTEAVMNRLLEFPLTGVAYWTVTAPGAEDEQAFNATVETLRGFRAKERGGMRVGLAFLNPYAVSAPLLQRLAALAKQNRLPLRLYLTERERAASSVSPIRYLKDLGVLEAQPSLVHVAKVSEKDIQDVQRAGCVVVYCPRSSRASSIPFPWELYAKHGVTVALGTDSSGSSPTLSVKDEVAAAQEVHGDKASAQALVWSAVKGGYRALGLKPPQVVRGDSFDMFHVWS